MELILDGSTIGTTLLESYVSFAKLKKLTIKNFDFSDYAMPKGIFEISTLEELYLEDNALETFDFDLSGLLGLKKISLARNNLKVFPSQLLDLREVKVDLSDNQIEELPPKIIQSRATFDLTNNKLDDLPPKLPQAQSPLVKIMGNPLRKLSEELFPWFKNQVKAIENEASTVELTSLFCWMNFHENSKVRKVAKERLQSCLRKSTFEQIKEEWRYRKHPNMKKVLLFCLAYHTKLKLNWYLIQQYLEGFKQTEVSWFFNYNEDYHLTEIPKGIFTLPALKNLSELVIADMKLKTIPQSISCLTQLRYLSFRNNYLTTIPDVFAKASLLKDFSLRNNRLKTIPKAIKSMGALEKLDLGQNPIGKGFDLLTFLPRLKELMLDEVSLRVIPASLESIQSLQSLYLRDNQVRGGFEILAGLPKLEELNLNNNRYKTIPKELENVSHLKILKLEDNHIRQGFEVLLQLPQLTELYLGNNGLTQMPKELVHIKNLTTLWLNKNQLGNEVSEYGYALPLEISYMDNLEELYLDINSLKNLPPGIGLLDNLKRINLSNNNFEEFPVELCELETLESIYFVNNYLRKIPDDIQDLPQLSQLDLRGNQLPAEELDRLKKLLPNTTIYFY